MGKKGLKQWNSQTVLLEVKVIRMSKFFSPNLGKSLYDTKTVQTCMFVT